MSIKFGEKPILECSSQGDKRFSAFFAHIRSKDNYSIETLYQGFKIFKGGPTGLQVGLSIREAKGRRPLNIEAAHQYYSDLWDIYFEENPELLDVIMQYNGFSDVFGQSGRCCQAEEIFRIHQAELLRRENE